MNVVQNKTIVQNNKKMKKILITLLLFRVIGAYSQTSLDSYIKTALSNNETIKQQQFLLTKSLYALKEAKSLFFPFEIGAIHDRHEVKLKYLLFLMTPRLNQIFD